jgi:hypothetical protein
VGHPEGRDESTKPALALGASQLPRMRLISMCEKCVEIDKKIEHLRQMILQLAGLETIRAARDLIKIMEAEKAKYHPG